MRNAYEPSKILSFASLLLVSGLLGLVAAFVIFPVFGGAGMVAKSAVASFESLPEDLKTPPPPVRSRIVAADGSFIAYFYSENRIPVKLAAVPEITRKAVIAIEDSRFYEHKGVDVRGITRAFVRNQTDGEVVQGASTLTQQYVKRVLLQDAVEKGDKEAAKAAVDKNKDRKIREIRYALALEKKISKDEILERYVNIAYFGAGAYGIGSAAQVYFGKPVTRLTLAESALLAGLLQSPSRYDPKKNEGIDAVGRRNVVLSRMSDLGFVPAAEAERAALEPLKLSGRTIPNGCANSPYGHFCDFVRRYLLSSPAFGSSREARQDRLFKGGLTIKTTLVPRQQKVADAAVTAALPKGSRNVAGLAVVQPGSGRVYAIAQSRTFREDQNPYITERRFQPGSTAKAFVLAAAVAKGLPLTTSIHSPYKYRSPVFYNGNRSTPYEPSNASRGMNGVYDMRSGFAGSINTYFVQLEERVGVDNAVRMALAMGLSNPVINTSTGRKQYDGHLSDPLGNGAFTLGGSEAIPLEMATAYATIAAGGVRCVANPIESATDALGKAINLGRRDCKRVLDAGAAAAVTEAMTWVVNPKGNVINGATGRRANIGRPVAGKTGTTQETNESWFIGFTPQVSTASVIFDPKNQVTLSRRDSSMAITTWATFMRTTLRGVKVMSFPPVPSKYLQETGVRVPDVTGQSVQEAAARLAAAGFSVRLFTQPISSSVPAGRVAATSPRGGSRAAQGSAVTLLVSNGQGGGPGGPGPPCKPGKPGCNNN